MSEEIKERSIWEVNRPETILMEDCFIKGRLKNGDFIVCVDANSDINTFVLVTRSGNVIKGHQDIVFKAKEIGDSTPVHAEDFVFQKQLE